MFGWLTGSAQPLDAGLPAVVALNDCNVPDPMREDQATFNACAVLIEAATALHVGQPPQ